VEGAAHIFHFAAQVAVTTSLENPISDFEINARGVLNLLEAIRLHNPTASLVFTSTNKVYGHLADISLLQRGRRYEPEDPTIARYGVSEDRPIQFHSPYGCSKGAADQYVLDYARTFGLQATVFRMSCIYGPHQCGNVDQGWVAHFVRQAILGKTVALFGDGYQVRDILYVEDLVDALLLAQEQIARTAGQVFNIGGGATNAISLIELLDLISVLHGSSVELEYNDWRAADQRYYVSDFRRFQGLTGWKPKVEVSEGVKRLYDWTALQEAPMEIGPFRSAGQNQPHSATALANSSSSWST
jgi:CDP-paratose 2-epimerase